MVKMASGEMERRIVEMHEAVNRSEEEVHNLSKTQIKYQEKTDNMERELDTVKKVWVPLASIIAGAVAAFVALKGKL